MDATPQTETIQKQANHKNQTDKELELVEKMSEGIYQTTPILTVLSIAPLLISEELKKSHPEIYYGFISKIREFLKNINKASADLEKNINKISSK